MFNQFEKGMPTGESGLGKIDQYLSAPEIKRFHDLFDKIKVLFEKTEEAAMLFSDSAFMEEIKEFQGLVSKVMKGIKGELGSN